MNRRNFLQGLSALIGGIALEQAISLGRVWSFPKEIKRATIGQYADFLSVHNLAVGTAIDPVVSQAAAELARRAAITYDTIMLTSVYYNKKVLDNLKTNLQF